MLEKEFQGFQTIAQRLHDISSYTEKLTNNWSILFEKESQDPEAVWVTFYNQGRVGRDGNSLMGVRCNINTIDNLLTMAKITGETDINNAYQRGERIYGGFGVCVYRTLVKLRDAEVRK